jgi:hypothetical protein
MRWWLFLMFGVSILPSVPLNSGDDIMLLGIITASSLLKEECQ